MNDLLCVGVAIYSAGTYRATRGVWESKWLSFERDTDDGRLLHGPIQFIVAVHRAHDGNGSGVVGLARGAREYLDGLADDYRGVNLAGVQEFLVCLETNPGVIANPPTLRLDDRVVTYDNLDSDTVAITAETFAEELDGYDESVVADAAGYTHEEVADGE